MNRNEFTGTEAERQIKAVLDRMGPYSLTKLVEAIDNGMVDGSAYEETNHRGEFYGCLLGWAGFLEHVRFTELRQQVFGSPFRCYITDDNQFVNVSDALELFVAHIGYGETPASNVYSAILREMAVENLAARQLTIPVRQKEEVRV